MAHTEKVPIPGVPVVRSGVSTKLFTRVFVSLKQRLLAHSSVTAAPRVLFREVAFVLEVGGRERVVVFGEVKF